MIYLKLFFTFFLIGAFTFGGGMAMLPLIQDAVIRNGWIQAEELINFIAVSESTPGPFAINISTFAGMRTAGILGASCATLGVVLPSFLIILIVAKFYEKFKTSKYVAAMMSGLKPAVVGLILAALISLSKQVFVSENTFLTSITNPKTWISLIIFGCMFYMIQKKVHPILIICLSAVVGIVSGMMLGLS